MNPFPRKMPQIVTVGESLLLLVEPAAAAVPRARQDQVVTIEKGSLLQLVEPPPAAAVTRVRQELPEGRGRLTSAHSAPSARAHMYKNPVKGEGK